MIFMNRKNSKHLNDIAMQDPNLTIPSNDFSIGINKFWSNFMKVKE